MKGKALLTGEDSFAAIVLGELAALGWAVRPIDFGLGGTGGVSVQLERQTAKDNPPARVDA